MKFGLTENDIELITLKLQSFSEIKEAILFGSRAMGNYKKGSDVDIALKGNLNFSLTAKVKAALEEEIPLPYFFDVIDYASIHDEELIKHIEQFGQVIFKPKKSS